VKKDEFRARAKQYVGLKSSSLCTSRFFKDKTTFDISAIWHHSVSMQLPAEVFQTLKSFAALELYRFFLAISDLLLLQPLSLFLGEILLLHAIRIGGPPACSGK